MDVVAEISALGELMSPNEVIAALTKNAAAYLDLSDSIGTLEPGKIADIVVIDGDPLANVSDLADGAVVIKEGRVVFSAP